MLDVSTYSNFVSILSYLCCKLSFDLFTTAFNPFSAFIFSKFCFVFKSKNF